MGGVIMPVLAKRFYLIVAIILLAVLIGSAIAFAPKSAKPKPTVTPTPSPTVQPTLGPPPTLAFTIKSSVGVDSITVTNQNSGATITLKGADLPATFNGKYGDTLTFKVTPATGYRFNAWIFGDQTFQSQNPYSIKLTYAFTMEAKFLMDVTG
jgi:hypothetical protein